MNVVVTGVSMYSSTIVRPTKVVNREKSWSVESMLERRLSNWSMQ